MQPIDAPRSLHYKNGKAFPSNMVFIGYILLVLSVFIFLGNLLLGMTTFLISLFLAFTTCGVEIDPENSIIRDYTRYLGFIKISKKLDSKKFMFVSAIPTKQSSTMYSRANSSTTNTDYFFGVCLLNGNYRNKTELTKFEKKSEAVAVAQDLSHRLGLEYFDYDPLTIREKMLKR